MMHIRELNKHDSLYTCQLGAFYFTIGNIHPKVRSKISAIQLLAVVKSTHLKKYGMNAILRPIIDDVEFFAVVTATQS